MKKKKSGATGAKKGSTAAVVGLAAASALLGTAAFPSVDWWPLAWCSLVPLLAALSLARGMRAFGLGLLFGSIHMMSLAYWVFNALYFHTEVGLLVSVLFLALVIGLFQGMYYGLFGWAAARIFRSGLPLPAVPVCIASAWVACEFMRAHLFSGVPWDLFCHSQHCLLWLIQIADITGAYGVSFLLACVNCSIFQALQLRHQPRAAALQAIPAIALAACVFFYGALRVRDFPETQADAAGSVALVQLSIRQDDRWREEQQEKQLAAYLERSADAFRRGARLLVWPENATQTYFQEYLSERLVGLLAKNRGELIVGAPRYTGAPGSYTFFNSVYLIHSGGISQVHDKIHLLPFGEYFPLGFIDVLRLEYAGPRQFSPGEKYTILKTAQGPVGPLVCFEIAFPEIVRGFVEKGAGILVNISNDAWFGKTSAHYQHFSMAAFRAVEFRRPVIRSANTGISGYIDAAGRTVSRLEPFQEGALLCSPVAGTVKTVYCRFGDVFAWACTIIAAAALLQGSRKRARQKRVSTVAN